MIAGVSWVWWLGFHVVVVLLLVGDWLLPGHRRADPPRAGLLPGSARRCSSWPPPPLPAGSPSPRAASPRSNSSPATPSKPRSASTTSLSFMVLFQGFHIGPPPPAQGPALGRRPAPSCCAAFSSPPASRCSTASSGSPGSSGSSCSTPPSGCCAAARPTTPFPSGFAACSPPTDRCCPVILAVEFTDLLFATDSIPAVLAVTHNPFVVYTSNIAAVLGLRSLYFALAAMLDRFRYLHYGLGALLGFVALKMLAARWIEVPITISLASSASILAVCAIASRSRKQGTREPGSMESSAHSAPRISRNLMQASSWQLIACLRLTPAPGSDCRSPRQSPPCSCSPPSRYPRPHS